MSVVPIRRPWVREPGGAELPLRSYELFQGASLVEETVWSNVMRGLSTRNYKEVLQQFADAYGLEKSTISEHFIEASRKKLQELMTRSLAHLQICAMIIDGTIFKGQHRTLLARRWCRGWCRVPRKTPRSSAVCSINYPSAVWISVSRVCICSAAAKRYMRRLRATPAKRLSSSAADSLQEGLEETLTVQELGPHARLRRSLTSTNGIESCFSVVETICKQVKRWQGSDHRRLRWVGSALLYAESRWNRLHGYRHMPLLIRNLQRAYDLRCALNGTDASASSAA